MAEPARPRERHDPTLIAAGPHLPRPRAGVILAAGRSERLAGLTGGGSKALIRLGGMALVERAIRTLARLGVERIIVVVGYHAGPVAAVARRASPAVQVILAEDWEEGNAASLAAAESAVAGAESFLLVTADHVFSAGALEALLDRGERSVLVDPAPSPEVWAEGTRAEIDQQGHVVRLGKEVASGAVDCGAFVLDGEVFAAVRRARRAGDATLAGALSLLPSLRAVSLPRRAWWWDVDTEEDLAAARRLLWGSLRRRGDGLVSRTLNRPLSTRLSWAIAPLRPPPALLSWLSFAVVVAGASLVASGLGIVGGILIQAGSVLDGVDGEVARLTLRDGPGGAVLDGYLDRLSDAAVVLGLAVWALDRGGDPTAVVALAVAATAGAMLSMAMKDRIAAQGLRAPSERLLDPLLSGRDARLLGVAILAMLAQPSIALGFIALTSLAASTARVALARSR